MIQKLVIDGRLPGLNEYLKAYQTHRLEGAKLKKQNTQLVEWYIRKAHLVPYNEIVYLSFKWIEPNKRRDKDNITAGGRKFILDALVNQGIIKDDGWKYIENWEDSFSVDKGNPRIEVTIRPYREEENETYRTTGYSYRIKKSSRREN